MATKAQVRASTKDKLDVSVGQRWSDARIDAALSLVFRQEWRNILNANPWYRWARRTPTLASGVFAITDLSAAGQSFYRIIKAGLTDGTPLELLDATNYALTPDSPQPPQYGWWQEGTNIRVSPGTLTGLVFIVNWRPPYPAADGDTVDFPTDYEDLLAYHAAALLLAKGGAETGASRDLFGIAEGLRSDMLADLQRLSVAPLDVQYTDSASDWAG